MRHFLTIATILALLIPVSRADAQDRDDSRKPEERRGAPAERTARPSPRQPSRDENSRGIDEPNKPATRTTPIPDLRPRATDFQQERNDGPARTEVRSVFRSIEEGIAVGSAGKISPHFASHVTLNLRGGESGSFSANQAYYVLEKFFLGHQITGFDFSSMSDSGPAPYAAGSVGMQGEAGGGRVYVALGRAGNRWVITQINIY